MTLSSLLFVFLVPSVFCASPIEKRLNVAFSAENVKDSNYRLPTSILPYEYELLIVPDFEDFTFQGETTIKLTVKNVTNQIILNQKDLNINTVSVNKGNEAKPLNNASFSLDNDLERLNITTPDLEEGNYTVVIKYNGTLTENMLGFYRSSYVENGKNISLAITQFESTYARQAFPCFDEPAFRASFTVKLGRDNDSISISNYPLNHTTTMEFEKSNITKSIDVFYPTAPMPTYLVAFSVNKFANLTDNNFSVYMRPDVKEQGEYLVGIGQTILDTIGNFLNITYSLPKMDVVAVPDFDAGAMENWGMTTYREKYVLYDSKINSAYEKQLLVDVVAHEFGHQWFGDLVTPEWWSYAWLNEAFATYFEYVTPSIMYPSWGTLDQYVYDNVQTALASDVGDPRAMTVDVNKPAEIDNLFDYVIYEKGGSILRMTEHFLTTDNWKAGLNSYLINNSYATGNPESLFYHLDAYSKNILPSDITVQEILQTWTTQPGYPVVTVEKISSSQIKVTQNPFSLDEKHSNLTWYVPLTYTTEETKDFSNTLPSGWLKNEMSDFKINSTGWVIFNIQQTGFYRVNYDENNWQLLTNQLVSNYSSIGSLNRAQLLDDSFKLARYNYLNYSVPLGITKYLSYETDYVPWLSAASNLRYLTLHLAGTEVGDNLKVYGQECLKNIFTSVTASRSESEAHLTTLTRRSVVAWACDWGLPECDSYTNNIFQQWYNNNSFIIPPEVKETVFCTGLRLNKYNDVFDKVWSYYLNSNNYAEKLVVMYSLGCTEVEELLLRYLNFLIQGGNEIRRQDKWIVYRAVVQRQAGVPVAMDFLFNNYNKLISSIGEKRVESMISSLASNLVQDAHIKQYQDVINNSTFPANLRTSMNKTLSGIQARKLWSSAKSDSISSWMSANVDVSSASINTSGFIFSLSVIVVLSIYYKYFTLI